MLISSSMIPAFKNAHKSFRQKLCEFWVFLFFNSFQGFCFKLSFETFFKPLSTSLQSENNSAFFVTHLNFLPKVFLGSCQHVFANFNLMRMRRKSKMFKHLAKLKAFLPKFLSFSAKSTYLNVYHLHNYFHSADNHCNALFVRGKRYSPPPKKI